MTAAEQYLALSRVKHTPALARERVVRPLRDIVIVDIDPDIERRGSILIGYGKVERSRLLRGTVVACGPKCRELAPGDRVVIPRSACALEVRATDTGRAGTERIFVSESLLELAGDIDRAEAL